MQERGVPRSLDEIPSYSGASRRDVARCCGEVVGRLRLRVPLPNLAFFVPRICERLGLSHATVKRAIQVVERARELKPVERTETIAAAAVYIAALLCGEPRLQKDMAPAAGASEASLRKASRELELRPRLPIFRR